MAAYEKLGKMPKRAGTGRDGGGNAETSGHGRGGRNQHPNGGETRPLDVNHGKMPKKMRAGSTPSTHLPTQPDVTEPERLRTQYAGRMPRRQTGGRKRLPDMR